MSDAVRELNLTAGGTQVRLYEQDCVAGMRERLEPGSVDVVVTSPPYNLGIKYRVYDDRKGLDEYLAWTREWTGVVKDVLSDGGSFFLNMGQKPSMPWVAFDVAQVVREHFQLQNVIHWIKSIAIMKEDVGNYPGLTGDVVVGHYKPIQGPRFVHDAHEYVFHFTKSGSVPIDRLAVGVPYQDKSNVARWQHGSAVHCRGNTWFVPYRTIRSRRHQRPHPATYPPKLAEMCIRLHGAARAGRVLDPFMGLGSTALGAVAAGVPEAVGFEIDPEYVDWAAEKLRGAPRLVQGAMMFGDPE